MSALLRPLIPATDDDLAANRRGVLSQDQEQELGHLLTRARRAVGADLRDTTAGRFVERLVADLAGSSVKQAPGRVAWVIPSTPGMPLWVTRPAYVAYLEGHDEPVPLLGAAMPGSYVLYLLPNSNAVVAVDAPGVDRRAPSQRHRQAYTGLLSAQPLGAPPGWAPAVALVALATLTALPALWDALGQPDGAAVLAGLPVFDIPAVRVAAPAALAVLGVALLIRRLRWRPRSLRGPLEVRWAVTHSGTLPPPFLQPAELLWRDPPRCTATVTLAGTPLPAPVPHPELLVPGAEHHAELDPRTGRVLALRVVG